jgi:hypothetical protein
LGETGLEEKKNIKRCPKGRVSDSIVPIWLIQDMIKL